MENKETDEWVSVEKGLPIADGVTRYYVFIADKPPGYNVEIGRLNEWRWHYGTMHTEAMIFNVTHYKLIIYP